MKDFQMRLFMAAMAGTMTLAHLSGALALPVSPAPEAGVAATQARGGFRGGAYYRPPGGYYRGPAYGAWRRPYYGWGPGGAIAAGAAIGFLGAAAAASYATSAAPAPGLCWYYTDATYSNGFWDYCP